jgi:ABC-type phosphate/phosphonate transport system substrate-binding protein
MKKKLMRTMLTTHGSVHLPLAQSCVFTTLPDSRSQRRQISKKVLWGLVNSILASLFFLSPFLVKADDSVFDAEAVETVVSLFKIGYLPNDPEAQLPVGAIYELRDYLLAQPEVIAAMKAEGITDLSLLAVDRHEAMVERMNRNEFDLAFCSAVDFVLQNGDYDARFQLRRPQDSYDARRGRVFHRGVIFVNNRNPLFRTALPPTDVARTLTTMPLAMVSLSAAGYFYPSLKIAHLAGARELPQQVLLCDSSEEVVKTVINGLGEMVSAGACAEGAIEQVLAENGLLEQKDQLVRVVLETDPLPGEPVAFHRRWAPRYSSLGRALGEAIQRFFSQEQGLPRVEFSSNESYQDLRANIREFWSLVGPPKRRR